MNIFHIYVYGRYHLVSLVIAFSSVLLGIYIQDKSRSIVYRFMVSILLSVFGHFMYENIFTVFFRHVGGFDEMTSRGIMLYLASTVGIGAVISISNDRLKFLRLNRYTLYLSFLMTVIYVLCFLEMLASGFFDELKLFYIGKADPHNLTWAISKALGLCSWFPTITEKNR